MRDIPLKSHHLGVWVSCLVMGVLVIQFHMQLHAASPTGLRLYRPQTAGGDTVNRHDTSLPDTPQGVPRTVQTGVSDWRPKVTPVGDPQGNYLNVEFTGDGRYMVWFEGGGDRPNQGIVWHCGVNQETGELIPPDGRGFRAFESTTWGRANPGCDQAGPYYVGADRDGRLILVRPEGPNKGRRTTLPTPPDPRRRAIYPTSFADRAGGFILFIQNEKTPGAGIRMNSNAWVELQYISLDEPTRVRTVERQDTPMMGFAPMDVGFVRWMHGRPLMTYGALSEQTGKVEIRAFNAEPASPQPFWLMTDGHDHIDPYPIVVGRDEFIFTGIDASATSHIYRRPAGQAADTPFTLFKTLSPEGSRLTAPSLAQSHEPFLFNGELYTVYQVNDRGRNFFETTFRKPGELWLAHVSGERRQQWLIAPEIPGPVSEPEPLVTPQRVWIFYNGPRRDAAPAPEADEPPRGRGRPGGRLGGRLRHRPFPRGSGRGGGVTALALYRAEVPLGSNR